MGCWRVAGQSHACGMGHSLGDLKESAPGYCPPDGPSKPPRRPCEPCSKTEDRH